MTAKSLQIRMSQRGHRR